MGGQGRAGIDVGHGQLVGQRGEHRRDRFGVHRAARPARGRADAVGGQVLHEGGHEQPARDDAAREGPAEVGELRAVLGGALGDEVHRRQVVPAGSELAHVGVDDVDVRQRPGQGGGQVGVETPAQRVERQPAGVRPAEDLPLQIGDVAGPRLDGVDTAARGGREDQRVEVGTGPELDRAVQGSRRDAPVEGGVVGDDRRVGRMQVAVVLREVVRHRPAVPVHVVVVRRHRPQPFGRSGKRAASRVSVPLSRSMSSSEFSAVTWTRNPTRSRGTRGCAASVT